MFAEISLVYGFNDDPIIFYSDLSEFGFVLIVPSSDVSLLLFSCDSCVAMGHFTSVRHLDIL
jgi:hypothetical protein